MHDVAARVTHWAPWCRVAAAGSAPLGAASTGRCIPCRLQNTVRGMDVSALPIRQVLGSEGINQGLTAILCLIIVGMHRDAFHKHTQRRAKEQQQECDDDT